MPQKPQRQYSSPFYCTELFKIYAWERSVYRFDDRFRELDCRGNQCVQVDAERVAQAICCVFQGDLNPVVVANELSFKVPQQQDNDHDSNKISFTDRRKNTHNEL